jgi:C-terminal processing protease CtpA/Prc
LLALLRANYVDFDKLPRKDADLSGLIAQSKGGLSVAPVAASNVRMFSVVLPGNVVYWRAGSFTPETSWHALATEANQAGSPGMVVDLRSNTTPDDYDGAMKVAAFMAPGQTGLVVHGVSLSAPAPAPETLRGQPTIVVLTDHETCGAAEALAACLKSHGALVMGEATQGKAAIFKQVSLTSGSVLRYATAHVYLADGTDLWDRPVQPDVTTTTDTKAEQTALAMIDENQVQSVIGEANERHRMSEAALVQGQDPEQDQFLESREKNAVAAPSAPVTRDVALVEAIDSLKAIHVLQGQDLGNSTNVAVR